MNANNHNSNWNTISVVDCENVIHDAVGKRYSWPFWIAKTGFTTRLDHLDCKNIILDHKMAVNHIFAIQLVVNPVLAIQVRFRMVVVRDKIEGSIFLVFFSKLAARCIAAFEVW